ncbi:MAG TPA: hypothetical protein VFH54_11085 [Mycobacteriales bacterium]|nr:hypothetical protein [Mycobacteriales bacterium]
MTETNDTGVLFPLVDGRRSTQSTARAVFADATRAVAPDVTHRIETARSWHKDYVGVLADVERVTATSAKNALMVATDGLFAVHEQMVFAHDGAETPLRQALDHPQETHFTAAAVEGDGQHPQRLAIPYRGRELAGAELHRQLDDWVARGVIEESCAQALRRLDAEPEWLDATDITFALIGAAAEMSPMPALLRWGATVAAVDLPSPRVWQRIADAARAGSGRIIAPVAGEAPGADLLTQLREVRSWLAGLDTPLVLGNYAYADGALFVRVAAAADALTADLVNSGTARALAYLASPTDVFAVPISVVNAARDGGGVRRRGGLIGAPIRTLSGGRMFTPNYRAVVDSEEGLQFGLADSVVPQQGPNYALAKRLQRWRAVVSRDAVVTSANVAPATKTKSVTKNRLLAAAYAGAGAYGVEVFEPETSSTMMAALLLHDLRNPAAAANPGNPLGHPLELFIDQAAHGGLWRLPWEPRSVLPLAAVEGLVRR